MSSPARGFSPRLTPRSASSNRNDGHSSRIVSSPARGTALGVADQGRLSVSLASSSGHREPIRSFIHSIDRELAPVDSVEYARSVREDTADLAKYWLSDAKENNSRVLLTRSRSYSSQIGRDAPMTAANDREERAQEDGQLHSDILSNASDVIVELPEPTSPIHAETATAGADYHLRDARGYDDEEQEDDHHSPSLLSTMLKRSPPKSFQKSHLQSSSQVDIEREDQVESSRMRPQRGRSHPRGGSAVSSRSRTPTLHRVRQGEAWEGEPRELPDEFTPLLAVQSPCEPDGGEYETNALATNGYHVPAREHQQYDVESQKIVQPLRRYRGIMDRPRTFADSVAGAMTAFIDPKKWSRKALFENCVVAPLACIPAVVVGTLLNILDALSYGMILFPLGNPIFANLGSAGISIFYVSTIISQLVFSTGSIFKGGLGSQLIEVVPFFHNMAQTVIDVIGDDDHEVVLATTIVSYALSSVMTGAVFYLMGKFKFGYIVGFIPRHILIGCIGGVGWFLIATGLQVSARLEGSFSYDLDTARRLIQPDTVILWIFPLVLAVVLFICQHKIDSKYLMPVYILCIPFIFYFFVFALDSLDADDLRSKGWIFQGPPSGEPWWYFYTLYKFSKVHWVAVLNTVPAMAALTFFGILHVPINVPALAHSTGEDDADVDRELKLHGYSNALAGLAGSVQNYLVYANTLVFMRSGGNSRLGGFLLAAATFVVMVIGPSIIGIIPVMMVGTLIFVLGFNLVVEALWDPRQKLMKLEYLTVLCIVLVMGVYDFVVGIFVGIALALVFLVIQTSRVSAVRAVYSGEVVGSTVRRNPSQQRYLKEVSSQISVMKLSGFLFFGTVAGIEEKVKSVINDDAHPVRFVVMDMFHVTGIDYSAGENFNTISRRLHNKRIELIFSAADPDSELGRSLRAIGVGADEVPVHFLPDLNSALEFCENELLKTLYSSQERLASQKIGTPLGYLGVPIQSDRPAALEMPMGSPRQSRLHEVALNVGRLETSRATRWKHLAEPLRLMMLIFHDLSGKNEDFWWGAASYFVRQEHKAGDVLFRRGDEAKGFYLLESGILRAEYDLPQGFLAESIAAGTTCGELPFFSETQRTATVIAERDCVTWMMDRDAWYRLERENVPVAQELLRISLKLTSERMSVFTNYILTTAS